MDKRWRIIFNGEIAYGFSEVEVKTNLQQLCKYPAQKVEELFGGASHVLKNNLDLATARRYKAALDQTGAVCSVVEMPTAPVSPTPAPNIAAAKTSSTLTCPKCGLEQEKGLTCLKCGVVFAKLRDRDIPQQPSAAPARTPEPAAPSNWSAAEDHPGGYLTRHPEQAFLLKALAMIVAIILLRGFLSGGILLLAFFLFPVVFLMGVRMHAAATGQNPSEILAQHITFMPVMYAEGERRREGVTWLTYSLIALNILIFYGIEIHLDPQYIADNLLCLPYQPNLWNVPASLFTSMFLHAGNGHLWGNMTFLWAVGTVVERRIGWKSFLALYLATGIAANLFGVVAHRILFGATLHALGASGAIAGVMGIFAVRCYFKSMVFPLPILGIFSLILPVSLKVRLNSLVIIGLFFLADLHGGIAQAAGTSTSPVGHWIHIGGVLAGVALALFLKLGDQAVDERHMEIGIQALEGGKVSLDQGEDSLRLALRRNPENLEATLLLARLCSKYGPSEEGKSLYRRALAKLARTRSEEAMTVYCEYFEQYMRGVDSETQLRLANLFGQAQDFDMASRCLEPLVHDGSLQPHLKEKAVFQYARVLDQLGLQDQARNYYAQFASAFPSSPFHARAVARINAL